MSCYIYNGKKYTLQQLLSLKNEIIADNNSIFQRDIAFEELNNEQLSKEEIESLDKIFNAFMPNIVRFSEQEAFEIMKAEGVEMQNVKGFVKDGKVYISATKQTLDTQAHEYLSHIFFSYIKQNNPQLFELLDSKYNEIPSEVVNQVKRNYPELDENSVEFRDEVMATYVGQVNREGVKKAISKKSLGSQILSYLNKIYNKLMRDLGFKKDYLSLENFNDLSLRDAMVYLGEGVLTGQMSFGVTSEDLANIMSGSPQYQKDSNYFKNIVERTRGLVQKLQKPKKQKIKTNEDEGNKVIGITIDEIGFFTRGGYNLGVTVEDVFYRILGATGKEDEVKQFNKMLYENYTMFKKGIVGDMVSLHYSNGIGNVFDEGTYEQVKNARGEKEPGLYKLGNNGLYVLDTSELNASNAEGYARGRIFVFNTDSTTIMLESLRTDYGLVLNKGGYRRLYKKNGDIVTKIKSTSPSRVEVDREALKKIKAGDRIDFEVDLNNEWNKPIVEQIRQAYINETGVPLQYYHNFVINLKSNGKVIGMLPATYDALETKNNPSVERQIAEAIRYSIYQELMSAIESDNLMTQSMVDARASYNNGEITQEEYEVMMAGAIQRRNDGTDKILPLIPSEESIPSIKTKGKRAIYNTSETDILVDDFIAAREKQGEKWRLGFYDKETNTFIDRKGKTINIEPNSDKKHSAIYLLSEDYQGRIFIPEGVEIDKQNWVSEEDIKAEEFVTRIDLADPIQDTRVILDYSINQGASEALEAKNKEIEQEKAIEDELIGNIGAIVDESGNEKKVVEDVETQEELETKSDSEQVTDNKSQEPNTLKDVEEEAFIMDIIPYYFDVADEVEGQTPEIYNTQENITDYLNNIFNRKYNGLFNLSGVTNYGKDKFKQVLNATKSLFEKTISFREYLRQLISIKNNGLNGKMDSPMPFKLNEILIIKEKATENSEVTFLMDNEVSKEDLLFNHPKYTYIQKIGNTYYRFLKATSNEQIESYFEEIAKNENLDTTVKGAMRLADYLRDSFGTFPNFYSDISFEVNDLVSNAVEKENENLTNC